MQIIISCQPRTQLSLPHSTQGEERGGKIEWGRGEGRGRGVGEGMRGEGKGSGGGDERGGEGSVITQDNPL